MRDFRATGLLADSRSLTQFTDERRQAKEAWEPPEVTGERAAAPGASFQVLPTPWETFFGIKCLDALALFRHGL